MRKSNREVNGEKVFRYSIRKYHFGAASVAVAALMFFANGAVKADTLPVSPATANTEKVNVGVTELTEGVLPKENPIEKSKEEVVGDKTPVAQKLVDKSPLVQAISELQAAIAKVDEESLVSLSNQLTQLTDENNRLLNGENISEEAIASQVSRVQFLTEQVRQLKSKTEDKASNKEDRSGSKVQDKKEFEVSENAVTLVNQTAEIKKSVKDDKVEEVFTNKTKLETLLKEIDKLDPEKYTEDSVKGLKEKVAKAKEVLTIAKNQEEVNSVYKELVNYKNSSLRRVKMTHKPLEENTPKLDTTNGKETVGKKAENTDPSDRNIAGHNHILNGTALPEGSGLRTAPKPELADVQIGRWNGTRRTFDSSNVFVTPANQGIVGNVMKIKAISASDNFTNIEVTGNQGFPLKVKKNIKGKEAELYFEGNTPSNGSWNMTVTATTAKGTKSFNFGYYTALRKPTILTQNTALEGKAKEKPTIEVEVPTFSPAPTGAKFKVYLVRGGSTNGWDNSGNAYPSGYSVLASADVVASTGGKGTATINASNYRVSELGTTAFKAITVIELNGRENDTDPGERGSWFSDERRATERLANKTALTAVLSDDTTTKGTPAYYNAEASKKTAYDNAVAAGKVVLAKDNATQTEVDNAVSAITNAKNALGGRPTNKGALQTAATTGDTTTKGTPAYYNAEASKKTAYDNAVAAGKVVLAKDNATQTEVDNAVSAITNAKNALGGRPTNKGALQTATSTGDTTTKGTPAYYNAEASKKTAYDNAVAAGKVVLAKDNATQTEVDNAVSAITNAKNALGGRPTNKGALQTAATTGDTTTKGTPAYYNAEASKKTAYDNAVAAGKVVLAKDNATQTEVDNAVSAITNAKNALGGRPTNKGALQTATSTGDTTTKGTPAYYNAEASKKTAYDNAVTAGKVVLAKDNATQTEVDNAVSAITNAKNALGGRPTNKGALQTATSTGDTTTKGTPAYYNAEASKKTAYDNAVAAGKVVLAKDNATQTEVDNAVSAITNAKNALGGRPTNKGALQTAATTGDTTTKGTPAYYNAEASKKTAYDNAVAAGKVVLAKDNATQTEVDNAVSAITNAKNALGGRPTNKGALQTATTTGDTTTKGTPAYYNAEASKKTAYDNAVAAGKVVLAKDNATQTEVDNAVSAITNAKNALGGRPTNKGALQTATTTGDTTTKGTAAYYNAEVSKKTAYDNAVAAGKVVLAKDNATQTEVDNAVSAITNAKNALGGRPTNKGALQTATSTGDTTTKGTPAYYNAEASKKTAYDNAVAAGKVVLAKDNATQTEVDNAVSAITNAKNALGGRPTNKGALQTATSTGDTTTKGTPAYYNAEASKKTAYDNAVAAGKVVLAKDNATQTEVDNAVSAITNAKNALGGRPTNKGALQTATSTGDTTTKGTPAYYNAEASKKTAYDNAIASGKTIFNKADATQTEVDNAVSAITNAKNALGGRPTNKGALQTATTTGDTTTKGTPAYYNAEASKKTAYDNAVAAGKVVLAKDNATQTEVNNALSAITTAKNALGGNATNKDALQTATSTGDTETKASAAYYNAEASKKTAYDNAVTAGKAVLAKDNATQTEVNDAVSAITNAKNALGGNATNKDALQTATSTGDTETKATPAYYNAEASKKTAYDNAVAAGKAVLAKDNATQTEVNDAVSAITNAKNALGGNATNKDALQTATSTGDTETKASAAYYNAEASKKTAYDNAVTAGKVVLAKDNATQTEVNNALSAITTAKNALGGNATNKDALQTATSTGDTETKATPAYYNAEASKKTAYDNAVAAGKVVLAKDNATQTEVNNALSAITTAKNALGGNATNKDALQTATSTGDTETKATPAYYNAEASKKDAYDQAVTAGKVVLAKDNATQTEVNNALSAITTAKNALGGNATNKDALQTATSTGDTETKASAAYYNAEASKKDAYDQAVTAGKVVLAKDNATQTEVNNALSAITTAKNALGGNATNKDALQTATSTGDTETKASAAYYNAEASKKTAYDNAVTAGKVVLAKDNATQTEVNDAVSAITNAKNALGGNATNKDALQTATSTGDTETKATPAYYNAEASKKTAYDNAVAAGKAVLAKDNATQTEVNDAVSAITNAKNALGGNATNKDALQTATSTGDTETKATPAYYNAEASKKDAYDQAVTAGKVVLAKDNATQTEVNNALSAITTAKNALGGNATNKDALQTATSTGDTETKATPAYYNAEASKKDAYDQAVTAGKVVLAKDNATQTEVNNALSAITTAKNALGGNATNKDALQTATSTGDTETKATPAYYNAEASKKDAYDQAVTAGKVVLAKDNATQTEVNNALSAITAAKNALGGNATNKDALQTATSTGDTETKASAAYYNAEASKKDAYDQAVTAGKVVLAKDNATQTEVNNALSAITTAKNALGGNATNKDALQTATSTGDTETKASAAYYNAEASKKDAYDQAVTAGKVVLAKDNATQTEVNNALSAITAAKNALGGNATNKDALQTATSTGDTETKASAAYYNAEASKKDAYDQAVTAGKVVLAKDNATQTEVNNALSAITTAKNALGGNATNKDALQTATSTGDTETKATPAYYNAEASKKDAYDQAVTAGKVVLAKDNATQTEVNDAVSAITNAKNALGGNATNKDALQTATSTGDTETKATPAYYNAEASKKTAYDNAVAAGKVVLAKDNATQTEVNNALSAITTAKNALGGNATNKDALQTATSTGDTETKASAAYYNAEASKKDAYDQAVTAGKVVLAKDNATQTEVNNALSAITTAKNALGGNATNKDALQTATSTGDTETKATPAYYNAEASKKDAYDQAVTAGKVVLAKDNATQTEVNDAVSAITNAKNALGGNATNKDALQTATSTGDTETKATPAYYNAEASKKTAYDNAVAAGKVVLAKDNATQTEVNNALSAITTAKNALGGNATNKDALQTATSTGDTETKASAAYYNAEASKKDAYDQAVTAGKVVLAKDNATQTEVNNALSAITTAKNALGGNATNKDALQTATSTGDTETKATPAYYNAEASKKDAYDQAVTAGKVVLAKDNATQTEVNDAVSAITNAKNALGGNATNKDALQTATSTGDTETKATPAYYNAEASKKTAYDNAVAAGKVVLAKDNATQTEVNNALSAITTAKNALGGNATNKDALQTATSTGDTETKASAAYYNAEASKKTAYDNAVTAGKAVLAKDNATQTEVNDAVSAITNAKNALGGNATNKDALQTATSTGDTETKATPAYYNAEASKKTAYDNAVAAGKAVLAKDNATQTEVNDAVSAITNAKNALGGNATNKDALQTATSTGDTETKASAAYYNAEASKKTAYDNAVTAGKVVLAKDNATQTEVNNALSAITTAKNALGGNATNKDALQTATSTGDTETKATPAYYNAEASKKTAYDNAVAAGKVVLAKDNATQTEVNNALSAITTAKNALGGNATNKDALQTATSTGDTETKATPAYYNAEASKKDAYDQAVTAGKVVLAKDNATQTEVNNALSAITTAKNALGGNATNKDALQTATSTGDTETKASAAYYNAEASKKDAYDQAVTAGKVVLAKDNATQTEVNNALSAITTAKNALGGNATNKDALQTATSTGDTETKASAAYYNAEASKKTAYDNAVTAGKVVLAKDNATQTEVNDAVSAITNAKNALGGNATNKDALQTATSTGDTETKATPAYYNAEASKKTAYDNAVAAGKAVLAKDNATQTEVNDAVSAITNAKNALGGNATNKDALQTATSTGDTETKATPAYYNAEASKKDAYDQAVTAGKVVLAKDNATQTEVNNALSAITTAKNALGGNATNKDALQTATSTGDTETKATPAYYNAEASKKDAYDQAVTAGKVVLAKDNATQTEVNNALSAITTAKNALGGNATNKDALQTATSTGDTETKATPAYYNAEASKKDAYDQAVTAGKVVLAKDNATQTEVNNALSAITAAKNALGGNATNKDALQTATSTGDTETKASAAYYNAEASKKDAYDQAVTAGKVVLAKDNATQTEVNNALSAITTAKNALGGNATNKDALQTATSTGDTETKASAAYYNAEASKKDAYDQAVTAGKVVLAKDNATQTEVNNALSAITAAKNALGGNATNKDALQTATSTGDTETKASAAYYNAEASKKDAYDQAVTAGKVVLAKDNATQTEVNNALSAITTAKNALGGNATNKDALQTATSTGDTETKATPAYYNAEASKKDAYDQAVTAGKVVLAKDNATQTEVNDAVSAITNAKNALGGNATNKDALQTATSTGDTETKATPAYYNAEASKKTAYDNAVAAGKVVLAKDNATQTEVNNALSAITTAKNALGGNATNKDALQTATSTGDTETKASAAYYNAEASKKDAYDQAVTAGKVVLAKDNATQTEVNNALSAITTAKNALGGNATNKDALQTATSTGDTETKATPAYYNAEASKKDAYDQAVTAGKVVLAKDNATQTEVNDAVSAITNAKNALGGNATNKDALQTATSTGDTETKATPAYYNAEASKKTAYDNAVAAGKVVLAKDNATQTEVNNALSAITTAKNALGGNATNKDALQTATSTGDTETKASAAYYNAEASKKDAYDQAVTAGKVVLAKDNATQTEVNNALSAITTAKNALGGNATNKDALQTATSTGDTETKATPAYYNAEASKKDAYDQAVTAGKVVLAKDNATQTEVNDAVSAITNAKNALGGNATNKDALQTATSTGDTETKATPAYYNAEASKKTAYDNAVAAGKVVLAKDNATQTEVNNALSAITTAKNALGGNATNKDALQTATSTGDTETKATPAYYNAEASKKDAYDQAVTAGKVVLAKDNATQTEVNDAVSAITNAKNALGGNATNKDALQTATSTGDTETKATPAYYNAEASKKTAYDNAVAAGKVVLAKDNATQTEVNNALSAITTAKNALGGNATNKDALQTATSTGDTETKETPAYYNAEASKKDAYDQAVTAGKVVLAKDNATQTEVNNALSAITAAKNALGGNATNKDALQTATSTGDTETKASAAYYNAEASKKDAYDQAVTAGKAVLAKDNATQTEVNDAVSAITNAKNALGGNATNKDALQTATSTGDTETKASAAYYNAEASKKTAYDNAVAAGKAVLAKDNATQTEVNDAVSAITNAKNALGGNATNKDALQTATSTGDTETKASAAYYNAEASKKTAYDNAVTAGKVVLAKDNATQTEVNNALSAITTAKNALGGNATNKDALQTATSTGDTETKASAAYYNAEASKKTAYDNAVAAGKVVLAKDNATQTEVNNALSAITTAKNALGGNATNKDALQTATSTGDTETKASAAYYNAEASKKTAYDNAVTAGKVVLAKDNATQTEVNDAVSAITNAKNALGGNATNKDALQTATSTGDTETKASAAYYNAEASKKDAYDQAVTAGKAVLAKDNATQTEVNDAVSAITNAKNALGGNATNKDALQTATSTGDTETKASAAYYNAEASKKTAYDNAVAAGKVVLAKDNATQTEVNDAVSAITNAKNALGGNATNKDALQTATSTGDTETKASAAYYNAEASKKTAYDNAVAAGKVVLAKDNATQTEVNDAVSAITNAKNALGGNATNKDALQTATSTGDTETKATPAYYNAEASKKDAYDQAVTAGKVVLAKDNATQTEVNDAVSAIINAKNALGGNATNKDALQTATSTGDTETKASAAYYNAEASKKTAYDNAVTAGKVVLAKDNATQTEVNNALSAITTAKEKLDGAPFPTEIEKSNAIAEVKKALDTKIKSIESSKEFTDNDKGILKDKAEKAAMAAIVRIKTATTNVAVETAKIEGIERINSIEANLPATLDFPEFTGEVNGEIVEPTETLKEEQGGENKPQPASVVPSDDTTREPEVVTSNSQPVSSENNVPKQNDSKSHAALPNTGTKEDRATGSLGVLSLLGAFGLLFAKKKKDDEEEA